MIIAIVENNKVVNDARGAVFQLIRASDKAPIAINNDGTYKGNVVADMQIMVAKAIIDGLITSTPQLQTVVNSLDQTIIDWASSGNAIYEPKYRCNGDSMHHVVKGMTIIRVEDSAGFRIENNLMDGVTNLSPAPFDECYDYHKGANIENAENESSMQQGVNIRGISVAAVSEYGSDQLSLIKGNTVKNFDSVHAQVMVGIDIQGLSDGIKIRRNTVDLSNGVGADTSDAYIALRIRKYSDQPDSNIRISDNTFSQETQVMAVETTRVSGCPHSKKDKEWKVGGSPGGCPFGFKNRQGNNIFP